MEIQTHGRLISDETTGVVFYYIHSGFVCLRTRFERWLEEGR